jgi:carbon-monoxide dehydrogenase large subunit
MPPMDAPFDATWTSSGKFAVGQPVARKEDPVLLRGEGRYSDDLYLPGQLHGVLLRIPVAHGVLDQPPSSDPGRILVEHGGRRC